MKHGEDLYVGHERKVGMQWVSSQHVDPGFNMGELLNRSINNRGDQKVEVEFYGHTEYCLGDLSWANVNLRIAVENGEAKVYSVEMIGTNLSGMGVMIDVSKNEYQADKALEWNEEKTAICRIEESNEVFPIIFPDTPEIIVGRKYILPNAVASGMNIFAFGNPIPIVRLDTPIPLPTPTPTQPVPFLDELPDGRYKAYASVFFWMGEEEIDVRSNRGVVFPLEEGKSWDTVSVHKGYPTTMSVDPESLVVSYQNHGGESKRVFFLPGQHVSFDETIVEMTIVDGIATVESITIQGTDLSGFTVNIDSVFGERPGSDIHGWYVEAKTDGPAFQIFTYERDFLNEEARGWHTFPSAFVDGSQIFAFAPPIPVSPPSFSKKSITTGELYGACGVVVEFTPPHHLDGGTFGTIVIESRGTQSDGTRYEFLSGLLVGPEIGSLIELSYFYCYPDEGPDNDKPVTIATGFRSIRPGEKVPSWGM